MRNSQDTEAGHLHYMPYLVGMIFMVAMVAATAIQGNAGMLGTKKNLSATVYDNAFQASLDNYSDVMSRVRPLLRAVYMNGEMKIDNCIGYLNVLSRGERLEDLDGLPAASHYAECLPLHVAHASVSPTVYLGPSGSLGRILAERLDASALQGVLPGWIKPVRRLGDAAVDGITVTDHAVTLRRGEETCIVEVVASADLTDTGVEGLVVRITGTATQRYAILQPDEAGALRPMAQSILLAKTGLGPTSEHGNSL